AAAFSSLVRARIIYQDIPDQCGCDAVEVCPIPPLDSFLIGEAQIRFVQQFRALQRMAAPLATKISMGEPVQLVVHKRDQPVEGVGVSIPPAHEQLSDPLALVCHRETNRTFCALFVKSDSSISVYEEQKVGPRSDIRALVSPN